MAQITLVQIIGNGSDLGLFLDDRYIISADPGAGDDASVVEAVATGLSNFLGTDVSRVNIAGKENWNWNDIAERLVAK